MLQSWIDAPAPNFGLAIDDPGASGTGIGHGFSVSGHPDLVFDDNPDNPAVITFTTAARRLIAVPMTSACCEASCRDLVVDPADVRRRLSLWTRFACGQPASSPTR